jgi:hypothetical protein
MKKIRSEDAVGETLCHDLTEINRDGVRSTRFRRGHVFTRDDIPALLDMGKAHIYAWDPAADEVHEEEAALELAGVIGRNINFSKPTEGKITLTAAADGLFHVNTEALHKINSVPDYTVAVRRNNITVSAGDKLGGLRIVPLVTKRENTDTAVRLAEDSFPVAEVKPFLPLKTGIIITGGEVFSGRIPDRFEPILRAKLKPFGANILGVKFAPDDTGVITEHIHHFLNLGAEVILLTGGMSVDPDDVTPTAIRRSSTEFLTYGVPMQPGNMLTLAYSGNTVLAGIPAASMKAPVTSFDIFLPRIFAGDDLRGTDFAALGAGGFCMQCDVCRYPVCNFGNL